MSWSYGVWLWTLMGALAPTKADTPGNHATGTAHREEPESPSFDDAHAGPPSLEYGLTAARAEEVGDRTASRIGAHLSDLPGQSANSSSASAKFYDDTFKKGSGTLIDTLEPTTSKPQEDVLRHPSSIAPGAPTGTSDGDTSGIADLPATALGFTTTSSVSDAPKSGPQFTSATTATAAEDVNDTAVLYTAAATDADATATLTYTLTDDAGGLFEIDGATGQVTLASGQSLDRETAASHSFTVEVSDGVHTASRTVTLAVTDVNEAPPVFTSATTATAAEDVNDTAVLYTAAATDADATATLTYTLTDDAGGLFEIDGASGEVTLAGGQSLDRETAASHSFTVEVSDGLHTASRTVSLTVTDVNEATPVFTSATTATAAEDVNDTAVLYTAAATDADATATLTYTLTDDAGGLFEIDGATGQVTLAAGQSLDHETAASHSFTVEVSDGVHTASRTVTLAVTDVNEATPVFTSGTSATAAEDVNDTAVLYTAAATDADATATLTYSLTDDAGGLFEIDAATGQVTLAAGQSLDRETAASHSFTVEVSDGLHTASRTVTLAVTDVNEATPVFTSATTATAAEDVNDTAVLYTAAATDADATAALTYSLTDDAGGLFEIDAASGEVTLASGQSLDHESAASHSFTVEVSDGVHTASRTVTLAVTDVNEAPTGISFANQIELAENTSIGSGIKVADILISDDALGTETLGLTGADAASFEIRNGSELYFIGASPDFEAKASYAVNVTADDTTVGSTPDVTQGFTLNITDVNEAPTAIGFANQITLAENTSIGSGIKVADILIYDDALGTETLGLTGDDAASFEIRNGSELYYIGASPDFEAKASYAVNVTADDTTVGSTPDVTQAFTLNIGDVNEAPVAVNDTNADDAVVEDSRNALGLVTFAGDPNATGNVLTNDSDPESDTLSVVGVAAGTPGSAPGSGVGSAIVGTYGSLTVAANGTWNYLLDNNDPDTANLGQLGPTCSPTRCPTASET